jgi:hypothetical protein
MQGRTAGRRKDKAASNFCLSALLLFCLATVLASGCARAKAKTVPDAPLDVPAPPPRDVETTETEPPPPATLVPEPARNTPARPRPVPPREQQRAEPARPEPPKPDAPPAAEPPKTEEPARPTPLQTMPPAAEVEAERLIRAALARANSDLGRVDYRLLKKDARTQYDTAKRFVNQADEALRTKNLVFAKNLADKAATLAAQLAGR